jgi:hypothetical protein
MCQAQLSKAMQGDARAANAVAAMLAKVGLLAEQDETMRKRWSADDEAILADAGRRPRTPIRQPEESRNDRAHRIHR